MAEATTYGCFYECPAHTQLCAAAPEQKRKHLREQLKDEARNKQFYAEWNGIHFDYSRQKVDQRTMGHLLHLADQVQLSDKIKAMFRGDRVNTTEGRSVLHTVLRLPPQQHQKLGGEMAIVGGQESGGVTAKQLLQDVHEVFNRIKRFAHFIRQGERLGVTGKPLKDVICVGIGGSFLGPEFVFEALKTDEVAAQNAAGRRLRFLANVDPTDVRRATEGFHPETTLVIIISKTFTTAETMLNARSLKDWLLKSLKTETAIAHHVCAVSTNMKLTSEFGINPDNVFGFWEWVGGRFSVTSPVGILPLAIHYGWPIVESFLQGCHSMDNHFASAPLDRNLPVLMGLLSVWNSTYLNYDCVAVLPYSQALHRFAAHIQQLSMESNGKGVMSDISGKNGTPLPEAGEKGLLGTAGGEIFFGEPGTNGQHSFYQLLHQGRIVPAEFIGFVRPQCPLTLINEPVSNHEELMSNFFAQPDALALGKTQEALIQEGVDKKLVPHKEFKGDRPSSMLLLPDCSPFYVGCLLALYEHRTAVEGFIWGLNSFDQWGVELGKGLAKHVRNYFHYRKAGERDAMAQCEREFSEPTRRLLNHYFAEQQSSKQLH